MGKGGKEWCTEVDVGAFGCRKGGEESSGCEGEEVHFDGWF